MQVTRITGRQALSLAHLLQEQGAVEARVNYATEDYIEVVPRKEDGETLPQVWNVWHDGVAERV